MSKLHAKNINITTNNNIIINVPDSVSETVSKMKCVYSDIDWGKYVVLYNKEEQYGVKICGISGDEWGVEWKKYCMENGGDKVYNKVDDEWVIVNENDSNIVVVFEVDCCLFIECVITEMNNKSTNILSNIAYF